MNKHANHKKRRMDKVVAMFALLIVGCTENVTAPSGPPISVSAIHLTGEFNDDAQLAEKRYSERKLKVGGNLDFFIKRGDIVELRFQIPGTTAGVLAKVDETNFPLLENAKPGAFLYVLCDQVIAGPITPSLSGCILQKQ